jgi:hypothetical protein
MGWLSIKHQKIADNLFTYFNEYFIYIENIFLKNANKLPMMAHAYNPSICEADVGGLQFKANLCYKITSYLKK